MRSLNLVLLAGAQLAAARSPSFSIHDDLLAFPQFEVVFAKNHVSEKDAQALLERNNQHPTYSAEFSHATGSDAYASTDAAHPAASASASSDEIAGYSYELLNMSPHKYLCSIPVVQPPGPVNETENALAKAEEEREHHRAAVTGWKLLNNFEDGCLYYVSGWWSYSFCKNREIIQFHAISATGNGQIPKRDPNGQEYILGQVPTLPATTGDRNQKKQRAPSDPIRPPAELQVKGDRRYLVQRLAGGTVCDLTGKERTVEVQYQCVPGLRHDKIGWIKEVVTCSYIMMINTPRLCTDAAFQPPVERPANPISCQLISDVDDSSRSLIDQQASSEKSEAEGVKNNADKEEGKAIDKKQDETSPVTIGGVLVGGKRVLSGGDDDGGTVKLQQLANMFTPQPKILEIIAQAASRSEGGKIKELTAEELESLNIDPKAVEEMREKLKKLAGDSGWKMEVFQMHEDDEKELLGYVDEPEGADGTKAKPGHGKSGKKEAKGGQKAREDKGSRARKGANSKEQKEEGEEGSEEGSEEKFYNRDEL
ncbi:Protein OS-9 [Conoideocrella luteorostrata]|uniref:Endoplasmic reticulum lectin n=1 Tax=Conoideocrella luteorostrata TaxID=1105319 RepID=A0AAJ0FXD3_9HYPO|nr:Protein OS-9 [Conoideocrella luteorostrata]